MLVQRGAEGLHVQVLVTAFTVVPSRSGAVRTFEQRTVLEQFNPRCVAVSLSGYIFFGSSVKISDKVMEVSHSANCTPLLMCLGSTTSHNERQGHARARTS